MRLCDGSVQSTGCSVAYQFEHEHHAVTGVLGNRQIHTFARLCGNLDEGIAYSGRRKRLHFHLFHSDAIF